MRADAASQIVALDYALAYAATFTLSPVIVFYSANGFGRAKRGGIIPFSAGD